MRVQRFDDFDEFAGSIRGIDSRMLLRDTTTNSWTISHLQLGSIELQVGQLGSGNIAAGQSSAGGLLVYLPLTRSVEYLGNGELIDHDGFFVIGPSSEFCICTRDVHDWAAITVPTWMLEPSVRDGFMNKCQALGPDHLLAQQIRHTIDQIWVTANEVATFEESIASERAGDEVEHLMERVLAPADPYPDTERHRRGRPRIPRDEIVRHAVEHLESSRELGDSVPGLAAECQVSERTLREIFHQYFGVGPQQYLRTRRLNLIHRALRDTSGDEKSVTDILVEHGEWAHGRFAKQYQQVYGERPSDTLARPPKKH